MRKFVLKDKIYDFLKWFALIFIPAIVVFLNVVLGALDVSPSLINVVTTIVSATGVLIGTLIGVSSSNYKDGECDG